MNDPIPVVFRKLPGRIHGFTCLGSDYEPIIVINEDLSPEERLRTFEHEMRHIERNELFDDSYNEYGDAI